jgi:hypothetical protein
VIAIAALLDQPHLAEEPLVLEAGSTQNLTEVIHFSHAALSMARLRSLRLSYRTLPTAQITLVHEYASSP